MNGPMSEEGPEDTPLPPALSSKPSSPEKMPETPPDVELPPLEEPTWEVRIRTAGGAESVAGPRWVACAMVSQLEFVHPETREPLRRADVESLEKAVQKQPAARRLPFSVLRAFELAQSQEGSKNWADGEELEEFQAAANAELEAMRAAAEKEERDRPESTARAERAAASSADGPTDKAEKEEDGWVTTKSRARRPAPTATQAPIPTHLFPYSRKFVQALLTDAKGATTPCVWVQRIEQQLLRLVNPAGGVRPSAANPPSVHFPP